MDCSLGHRLPWLLLMAVWSAVVVKGQVTDSVTMATSITPSNTISYIVTSTVTMSTPVAMATPEPHPSLYPPCNGEYNVTDGIPEESVFEIVVSAATEKTAVRILIHELEDYLDNYCMPDSNATHNCIIVSNVTDDGEMATPKLFRLYNCTSNQMTLLLGLSFLYTDGILTAESAINAIQENLDQEIIGFSIVRQPTQNVTMETVGGGLTTDQVVGVVLGLTSSMVLVLILTTVVILFALKSKKQAKIAVLSVNPTPRDHLSPTLLSHGQASKHTGLANADI